MSKPRRKLQPRKLLTAAVGVATVSYVVGCETMGGQTSGNLVAPPEGFGGAETSGNLVAPPPPPELFDLDASAADAPDASPGDAGDAAVPDADADADRSPAPSAIE